MRRLPCRNQDEAHLGRYGDVLKTPSSGTLNALQMSFVTNGVAVAVKQITRSALISCTNRATRKQARSVLHNSVATRRRI